MPKKRVYKKLSVNELQSDMLLNGICSLGLGLVMVVFPEVKKSVAKAIGDE